MIYIHKDDIPSVFVTYSQQEGAHFDDMPTEVKQTLRESLWREQGGICAYCMQSIKADGQSMKIEHFHARNSDNELDYRNLLAVCHGGEDRGALHHTCDTCKGNREIHISPLNKADMLTISYTSNGEIKTSKPGGQDALDIILNLNDEYLIYNRRNKLIALKREISKRYKSRTVPVQYWKKVYDQYSSRESGPYSEFVGILLWYLKKKI